MRSTSPAPVKKAESLGFYRLRNSTGIARIFLLFTFVTAWRQGNARFAIGPRDSTVEQAPRLEQ